MPLSRAGLCPYSVTLWVGRAWRGKNRQGAGPPSLSGGCSKGGGIPRDVVHLRSCRLIATAESTGGGIRNVEFPEARSPLGLSSYIDSLSSIGPPLRPTQESVNEISEALSMAASPPSYTPYIAPGYSAQPWPQRMAMLVNSPPKWPDRVARVPGKQDIAFRMWLRRHLRFVFAAGTCRAWGPFGRRRIVATMRRSIATRSCASWPIRHAHQD